MTARTLMIIGLLLNMVGTALLFRFGFPQPSFEEEVTLSVEDNTVFTDGTSAKQLKEEAKRKKKLYKRMAYAALTLLFIGFTMQFAATLST